MRRYRNPLRVAVPALGLLLVAGVVRAPLLGTTVLLLVLLALPIEASIWRVAGAAAAVAITGSWPMRSSIVTADAREAAANLAFERAFVAGALLGEVAYAVWRAARDREVPLR